MPRTRQLPDLFRPRYSRLALPARRPEKSPIQVLCSWIHSLAEIVGQRRGGVSVTAEINAYRERINSGMSRRFRGVDCRARGKLLDPRFRDGDDDRLRRGSESNMSLPTNRHNRMLSSPDDA